MAYDGRRRVAASAVAAAIWIASGAAAAPASAGPTPEEYVAHVGGDAVIVEPGRVKLDGYRILASRDGDDVRLTTRSGRDASASFPEIAAAVRKVCYV